MLSDEQIKANGEAIRFTLLLEQFVRDNLYSDFKCNIKLDWAFSRRSSRGGIYKDGPGINIAMAHAALVYLNGNEIYRFYEYPSFDADKYIGGFYSTDYTHKLHAIIAHEVAHAVQFFEYKKLNTRDKPHGVVFKKYYKILREEFVNKKLPTQQQLTDSYTKYAQSLKISTHS
jgi:hypothetical protein